MTSEQAGELIDGAMTGSPAAIRNLIAGGISAKMTWHDPNRKPRRLAARKIGELLKSTGACGTGGSR